MTMILAFFFVAIEHPWVALGIVISSEMRDWLFPSSQVTYLKHDR